MKEKWNLWVEFKSEIKFRKFLTKVRTTPALRDFLSANDASTKIMEFKFELNPEPFAKTFPKSACNSVVYGKEGTTERFTII